MIDIRVFARLARLSVSEEEGRRLTRDLDAVIAYVSRLQEVSSAPEDEPLSAPSENVLRDDNTPHPSGLKAKEFLLLAPAEKRGYVRVEKVL